MASLASHPNVWNTCLEILHRKGFDLAIELHPRDDGADAFRAERDGFDFVADDPIELLGLVAIYEHVEPVAWKPYWWSVERTGPTLDTLRDRAFAARETREGELRALAETCPDQWASLVRETLENTGGLDDAACSLGISSEVLREILPKDLA
jgi:hypothetical protein